MGQYKLAERESAFAELIWAGAPMGSTELVRLCEKELQWKKSTTYTMLKRLEDKGIFRNENGVVSARVSREDFYAAQSNAFVQDSFGGSLPQFLAAFTRTKKLSEHEIRELQQLIDRYQEQEG